MFDDCTEEPSSSYIKSLLLYDSYNVYYQRQHSCFHSRILLQRRPQRRSIVVSSVVVASVLCFSLLVVVVGSLPPNIATSICSSSFMSHKSISHLGHNHHRYSTAHGRNCFSFFFSRAGSTSFCASSTSSSHKQPRFLEVKVQQKQQRDAIISFGLNAVTAGRATSRYYCPSKTGKTTTLLFSSSSSDTTNKGEDDILQQETNNMLSEESYYNDISSMENLKSYSLNHLQHVLYRNPEDICQVGGGDDDSANKQTWRPRMAKDINYAKAVQTAWMDELKQTSSSHNKDTVYCCPIRYYSSDDKTSSTQTPTSLYGHLIWNEGTANALMEQTTNDDQKTVEYIVLFHTGAGTQDLFLHWKAHSLCLQQSVAVLIADLLGDPNGIMGWNTDRTSYAQARDTLLQPKDDKTQPPHRPILQQRIQAAFDIFNQAFSSTKPKKFNVMGWCFGGHPVLEIMLSPHLRQQVKSATTFHGVIDGIQNLVVVDESSSSTNTINNDDNDVTTTTNDEAPLQQQQKIKLLICHGRNDPFISKQDLELYQQYLDTLSTDKIQWSLLEFGSGVRHGFTNPAQDFHPNQEAFQYNVHAANLSWNAALTNLFS